MLNTKMILPSRLRDAYSTRSIRFDSAFYLFALILLCAALFLLPSTLQAAPHYAQANKGQQTISAGESDFNETPSEANAATSRRWAKGRLLLIPRAGLSEREFDKTIRPHGIRSKRRLRGLNAHVYELPEGVDEVRVMNQLRKGRRFKAVELDRLLEPAQTISDPAYNNSWALPKIQAPGAWDITAGEGITIAILDTGVDSTHPDLAANMLPGWNMYDNNSDTRDVYGHGTKVAGAAAAVANNGAGSAGVAWNAQVMPIRISRPDGRAYTSTMAQGIRWAADNGARVANISYGGAESLTVQAAANYMRSKGGIVVMSAGNTGGLNNFPPSDAIIVASATDKNDNRPSWSSYGPYVDVAAPGSGIYTTLNGGGYGSVSGTSFSSPVVAATTALMLSANPELTPEDVDLILTGTALDIGIPGRDDHFGHGRINAAEATAVAYARISGDNTPPQISITSPTGGIISDSVPIDVSYSDNKSVVRVELYANGNKVIEDNEPPFAFAWDTTTVPDGDYTLVTKAYDAAGNEGTSSPVMVTVENTVVDTTPPTIRITSPTSGIVAGSVPVHIEFDDDTGVVLTELYVNGQKIIEDDAGTTQFIWNTETVADGTHTLTAYAFDAAGNQGISAVVTVTVKNIVPDTTPPTINITSPTGGTVSGSVDVNVNFSDNIGVVRTELHVNGNKVAENNQGDTHFSWDATTTLNGSYTLTAYAFDAAGNRGISPNVTITVKNPAAIELYNRMTAPPEITQLNLNDGEKVGRKVNVHVKASSNTRRVNLKVNGKTIATSNVSSLSYQWDTWSSAPRDSTLTVTAEAINALGTTASETVTIRN